MKDKFIIGRYLPLDSIIHRLDPRAKLIFVFFFIIIIFFAHSVATYASVSFNHDLFETFSNQIVFFSKRAHANMVFYDFYIYYAFIFD